MSLLELKNITKRYHSGEQALTVLHGIDYLVPENKTISIMGRSGSGKSTLLHLMGGLDRPTSGEILYQGQPLHELSGRQLADYRNRQIGFVFQFHHLLGDFTALENIMMPLLIRGDSHSSAEQLAAEWLERVALTDKRNSYPSQLSGGEQQRIAIARAAVGQPRLLLADEPTGNLDEATGRVVMELLFRLQKESACTLIYVTHNASLAGQAAEQITLKEGTLTP